MCWVVRETVTVVMLMLRVMAMVMMAMCVTVRTGVCGVASLHCSSMSRRACSAGIQVGSGRGSSVTGVLANGCAAAAAAAQNFGTDDELSASLRCFTSS